MSDRKLFGLFSGTHLTVLTCAAVLASSAAYAVSVTSVAITDPDTGNQASIDNSRHLRTYDQISGYTKNPAFMVNITAFSQPSNGYHSIYTVPNGKALVIKSITWSYYFAQEGSNSFEYIYDNNEHVLFNFEGLHAADTLSATLDGIIVGAGALNLNYSGVSGGVSSQSASYTFIQGYLIPASAVPAAGTAEAAEQFVTSGRQPGARRAQ